jgi:hypothetical protein
MKWPVAAVAAAMCCASAAWAQMDMTANAIMLTVMSMNQPPQQPYSDPCTDCQRLHKVAILSAQGSSVPFEGRGKNGVVDLSAWTIDAEMTAVLKSRLAGRFEFVDVAVDPKLLAANVRTSTRLKALLKTVPNPGVDAYIVVRPVSSAPGTEGLSLTTSWHEGDGLVRALYEIDIFDAKTLSRLAYADSQFRRRENEGAFFPIVEVDSVDKQAVIDAKTGKVVMSTTLVSGPKKPCGQIARIAMATGACPLDEKKFTPAVPTAPSEETKAEVRDKIETVLADAVPDTLFRIGMDSDAP